MKYSICDPMIVAGNERYLMALNPIVFTEKVVRSFLRYQLTAYPFADERLLMQMRRHGFAHFSRKS